MKNPNMQNQNEPVIDGAEKYEMDFNAQYSANLPSLLKELNISLAFTSYQAGRLMLVRTDGENLDINFKQFPRPMGLTASKDSITLGTFSQIVEFRRQDQLLEKIKQPLERIEDDITAPKVSSPKENGDDEQEALAIELDENAPEQKEPTEFDKYIAEKNKQLRLQREESFQPVNELTDACFIARSAHYSGMINIHDIDWGQEGLWAVNSSFSCLCTIEPDYSFVPRWKPHFISELKPEDRCHLNGMTLKNGKPAYVTTFSKFDYMAKWRDCKSAVGTLIDVEKNEVLVDELFMPHSPRWHQGKVYFCNSGLGQVCSYNPETGKVDVLLEVQGFTRGMHFYGPLMFVGLSKVRKSDAILKSPLAEKYEETYSGIWVVDTRSNKELGFIKFTGNVDQIYDIAVVPDASFVELIEPSHPRIRNHFCHPELQQNQKFGAVA